MIVAALLPVFVLMAMGWALTRIKIIQPAGEVTLNALLYWVLLPLQLFVLIAQCDLRHAWEPRGFLAAGCGFIMTLVIGWLLTPGVAPAQRGSLLNAMARANGAFVGLPVVLLLARGLPESAATALCSAYAILLAVMVPLFNLGAVIAFLIPHHGLNRVGLLAALRELPRNPILIGCTVGVVMALAAPGLVRAPPVMLRPFIDAALLLAAAAVPMALLLTGSRIELGVVQRHLGHMALVCVMKLLVAPLLTVVLGLAFAAPPAALAAAVIINACPAAMAAVAMARQLGSDDRLLAGAIAVTTIVSPLTLYGWLWWLASRSGW